MTIKVGDKIPSVTLMQMKDGGPKPISTEELFKGKKVALFALPGAFTPTCSAKHLPGYIQQYDALKAKGIDAIACLSVNDAFVMGAWGTQQGAGDKVTAVNFAESAGAVNTYPIAVLKQSKDAELAGKFVDLVTGEAGQKVLNAAGFAAP